MMRGRNRLHVFGGIIGLIVLLLVGLSLLPDSSADQSRVLPAETLSEIARENDQAAANAVAARRSESAANAEAADDAVER